MNTRDINLDHVSESIADYTPNTLDIVDRGHAAVAMVLRDTGTEPEVLFIVRAEHEKDPWSGNIGFPGGRLNHGGETARQAAERETLEELQLDLGQSTCLGRLDDLYGATLPVLVSCFVYRLDIDVTLQPNHEVAETFWFPLTDLLEQSRHKVEHFIYGGDAHPHPVVEILDPGRPFLWGITYRLIRSFFALCDIEFGTGESY